MWTAWLHGNHIYCCKYSHNTTDLTADVVDELDARVEIKTCRQEDGAGSIAILYHIGIAIV